MADILRIKRRPVGGAAGAPAAGTIASAEIAFNEQDNVLYYGKGDTGAGIATSIIPIGGPGGFLPLPGGTLTGGLSFGAQVGATNSDLSKHLTLHTAGYGVSITANRINIVSPAGATISHVQGGIDRLAVNATAVTSTVPVVLPGNPTTALQAAPMQYVDSKVAATVTTWNTRTGAVTLTTADITGAGGAPLASPVFTGVPAGPTAAPATSTTQLATTAFVTAAAAAINVGVTTFNTRAGAVTLTLPDVTGVGGAPLASPSFSGIPAAPTAAPGTNNTQLATTAFAAAAAAAVNIGVATFNTRSGAVTLAKADVDAAGGPYLALAGGTVIGPTTHTAALTMTGATDLTLARNPTGAMMAVPKQYVDARIRTFNVRLYGAVGNGIADDTAAIQACMTAAGVGNTVYFPAGTYFLSATLHGQAGQHLEGDGPNYTTLHRTGDYGDTIVFTQAWDVAIRNLFITHSTMYGLTDTSLPNRVTSVSSHIRFGNAQGVVVEDCWIWRMPYQITINDGALVKIHRCNIQGCWDPNYVAAQEGIAAIDVGYAAYTQIVTVEHCYFGGSGNGPRPVSWTSADRGTITVSMTAMCGNQYGVRVIQCEDFLFSNNYVGGNVYANIYGLLAPGSVNLDWRITGNFIDGTGATGTMIRIFNQQDGDFVTAMTIGNNVFNGELQTMSAIAFQNITGGIAPVVNNFAITGNTFSATVGSAMMLYHCRGGVISGNSITGYNARQVTLGADLAFCAAVYFAANTTFVYASGNIAGGLTNTTLTPSYCYKDFWLTGAPGTNFAINNLLNGCGQFGNVSGMVKEYVVEVFASGNYTMRGNEDIIIINKTVNEGTQVQLPAGFAPTGFIPPGYTVTIKDGKGNASSFGILLIGVVDGVTNPIIATNYGFRKIVWDGNTWSVIASS